MAQGELMPVALSIMAVVVIVMAIGCGDSRPAYSITAGGSAGASGSAGHGAAGGAGRAESPGTAGQSGVAVGGTGTQDAADQTAASGNTGRPSDR